MDDKHSIIIQKIYAFNTYSKDMLISNISVDGNSQTLEPPPKIFTVSVHQEPILFWL